MGGAPPGGGRHDPLPGVRLLVPRLERRGEARDFMVYLGGVGPYRAKCEEVAARGYEGFALTASARHSRSPASAVTS
jgi:hypothetical protein